MAGKITAIARSDSAFHANTVTANPQFT